ncbi:MAG: hypothetical protein A2252_04850 [Elusimicrobia bacterium RIFOXYA2_FULL_39_19]|nr:MAG: hypothetical protein A2252_04850 [Elusimicrobia bacterium RIFOXYA2_FULL_39_19]
MFLAQKNKIVKPKTSEEEPLIQQTEITATKTAQTIPIIPAKKIENKEKTSKEAIAVAGEYMMIAKKSGRNIFTGQNTLKQAKIKYANNDYDLAINLARKSIDEFKSAKKTGVYYVVRKYDCLWKIAGMKKHYNKGWMWPEIWKANKNIVPNPRMIYPKQKLLIPDVKNNPAR